MQDNRASGSADRAHHARTARGAATFFITPAQVEDAISKLGQANPNLSARTLPLRRFGFASAALVTLAVVSFWLGGLFKLSVSLILVLLFGGAISLRLIALVSGLARPHHEAVEIIDNDLPNYTILVPLFREETIVLHLIEALDRLHYPRSKLQILFLLEEEDQATRAVLERIDLGPHYALLIIPKGQPQTKPRALNIGLAHATGDLICIYDAEDQPDPTQLRQVVALFARSDAHFACLQCPLNIYNGKDSPLAALFALEYAALFHLLDPGLANLRLPVPLGGTSNHFRTHILRDVQGWDAWNVTEDADIGLRLARRGYLVGTLFAPTFEEAPARLHSWLMQRKRWMKGWLQTSCVLLRDPLTLLHELGVLRSIAVLLLLAGGVLGPLSWPIFAGFLTVDMITGRLFDFSSFGASLISLLWSSTAALGLIMAFVPLMLAAQRCKITQLLIWLPLVPLLYLLLFVAAGLAVYDLFKRPHYWDKTSHGHGVQKQPKNPPFG